MFKTSSFSGGGGCVEVGIDGEYIIVRDSNHPKQELAFTRREWEVFLLGVKDDEFDLDVLESKTPHEKEDTHGRS